MCCNASSTHHPPKSVAVIGSGSAGLVTARQLARYGLNPTIFEQSHAPGGVWIYTDDIESDDLLGLNPSRNRVHSSMYADLRTNLPREVMGFSEYPFDDAFYARSSSIDPRRFCSHQEVLHYLNSFAKHFNILQYIEFHTRVTAVIPQWSATKKLTWHVTMTNTTTHDEQTRDFDAVVVCNGHYSQPRVPSYPNQDRFLGTLMHSHNYRKAKDFIGQRIVVIGAAFSGVDIAAELVQGGAAGVYLSARNWKEKSAEAETYDTSLGPLLTEEDASNTLEIKSSSYGCAIMRVHSIKEFIPNTKSIIFEGNIQLDDIDLVLFATGYHYTFPFLQGLVTVDDNRVGPLYKHVFPINSSSTSRNLAPYLSFVGLPWNVVPFPQHELQATWIARCLSGAVELPTQEEMMKDTEDFYLWLDQQGIPKRYTHRMKGELQWQYNSWLVDAIKDDSVKMDAWRVQLYQSSGVARRRNILEFRDVPLDGIEEAEKEFRKQVEELRSFY